MSPLLESINFGQIDAATTEQKKALMRLAADELRVSQTSIRFHSAYRKVVDEGWRAKDALTDMVMFEDRARQEWVDRSLQPWCDRHGLTLKQGLSVLFNDHSYNPENPSRDLVTKESVFGWSGQQIDFSLRLMEDMKGAVLPAAAAPCQAPSAGVSASVVFNRCAASVEGGILKLDDGTTVDLLKVQAACNYAFQETGDHEFSGAADEIAKATGVWQGPHGEWRSEKGDQDSETAACKPGDA